MDSVIRKCAFVTLVAVLLACSDHLVAQNSHSPFFEFGVKAGANTSRVAFDPGYYQDLKIGIQGGISYRHFQKKGLGILVELNYMQAGWKESPKDYGYVYNRYLHYIQVPVISHFAIGSGRLQWVINVGPFLSGLIYEDELAYLTEGFLESPNVGREIKNRADFGVVVGLGPSLTTKIGTFVLEGRISYSLTNLFEVDFVDGYRTSSNQVAEVSLNYYLPSSWIK